MEPTVAVLGTRYPDLSVERDVLGPEVTLVRGDGAIATDIVESARSASVIISGSSPRFTSEVITQLDGCRAIIRAGIGVDSIDLEAARSAGIWVLNVPDYGTEAVALHTIALALAAVRRLNEADVLVRSGSWGIEPISPIHMPSAMTAGVVGYGRIGRRVAGLLVALGFENVRAHDPNARVEDPGVDLIAFDDLLESSDLVTLHAPAQDDRGRHLISRREFGLMKTGSILVNTARGSLVDQPALAAALATRAPRIAALDVFDEEPPDLGVFREVQERLILTPHMAWYSEETQMELRRRTAEQARLFLAGESPDNAVVHPEE